MPTPSNVGMRLAGEFSSGNLILWKPGGDPLGCEWRDWPGLAERVDTALGFLLKYEPQHHIAASGIKSDESTGYPQINVQRQYSPDQAIAMPSNAT